MCRFEHGETRRTLAPCADLKNLELLDLSRIDLTGDGIAALEAVCIDHPHRLSESVPEGFGLLVGVPASAGLSGLQDRLKPELQPGGSPSGTGSQHGSTAGRSLERGELYFLYEGDIE